MHGFYSRTWCCCVAEGLYRGGVRKHLIELNSIMLRAYSMPPLHAWLFVRMLIVSRRGSNQRRGTASGATAGTPN
eukprot:5576102-Amphidinium_carterae.1